MATKLDGGAHRVVVGGARRSSPTPTGPACWPSAVAGEPVGTTLRGPPSARCRPASCGSPSPARVGRHGHRRRRRPPGARRAADEPAAGRRGRRRRRVRRGRHGRRRRHRRRRRSPAGMVVRRGRASCATSPAATPATSRPAWPTRSSTATTSWCCPPELVSLPEDSSLGRASLALAAEHRPTLDLTIHARCGRGRAVAEDRHGGDRDVGGLGRTCDRLRTRDRLRRGAARRLLGGAAWPSPRARRRRRGRARRAAR